MKRFLLLFASLPLVLGACSGIAGDIEVHNSWVRPTARGENAAVYFSIHNHSNDSDELIGASTTITNNVEIHESSMVNDVMQMEMAASIPLDAGEEIIFHPGGLHVMLVGIDQDLERGAHIELTLHFKDHEDVVVSVHVEGSAPVNDDHTD